jgi:hypothetical protein
MLHMYLNSSFFILRKKILRCPYLALLHAPKGQTLKYELFKVHNDIQQNVTKKILIE